MALSPFTPWGDESATPAPVEDTVTGVSGSWSTLTVEEAEPRKEEPLPEIPEGYEPYSRDLSEVSHPTENLLVPPDEGEETEEISTPTAQKSEDLESFDKDAAGDDPVPDTPDVVAIIDEMGMPYRVGRAFELLYNVHTASNLVESIYRELESYFKAIIQKYNGDFYATAAECSQNPDLTLTLWGVDYPIGCMMKSIINFCIQGTVGNIRDALTMLYTVGIAV